MSNEEPSFVRVARYSLFAAWHGPRAADIPEEGDYRSRQPTVSSSSLSYLYLGMELSCLLSSSDLVNNRLNTETSTRNRELWGPVIILSSGGDAESE